MTFLEEVASDIHQKLGDNLKDSALVFVNKRPLIYMQNFLAKLQKKPIWSPFMFTIQEFFALSTEKITADSFTQFFTLWSSYQELLEANEREEIRIDRFYRTGLTLLSDFLKMDEDLVPVNQLFEDLRDISLLDAKFSGLEEDQKEFLKSFWASFSGNEQHVQQEKFIRMWQRMPALYESFHDKLSQKGLITEGMVYRNLAEGKADIPHFTDTFKDGKLIFIGFNALSKSEVKLFQHWQKEGRALFYFDDDAYYMKDKLQEAGRFLRRNIFTYGLINTLTPIDLVTGSRKETDNLQNSNKTIKIYSVQGQTAQAKLLPNLLLPHYPELKKGIGSQVAIILADENLLIPVLQSIPTHFPREDLELAKEYSLGDNQMPLNITMGFSLSNSTLFGLINSYLSVQEEIGNLYVHKINYREVEVYINHPYIPLSSSQRSKFLDKLITAQRSEIPLSDISKNIPGAHLYFKSHTDGIDSLYTLLEFITWIREDEGIRMNALDEELAIATILEINKLLDGLIEFKDEISFPLVLSLVKRALKLISIPLVGEPLVGLQIMGLLETRSLDFETIYILGASESNLPKASIRESLIPESILKAYGLPILEDADALSAYIFYRLFQRAKHISVFYNSNLDENNSGEESRFLKQLEFESGHTFQRYVYAPNFESKPQKAISVKKEGRVLKKLMEFYKPHLNKPAISASGFTTYLTCPLQFYYKYIAGIREEKEIVENLESNNLGSIVHAVMQNFYQDLFQISPEITAERIHSKKIELKDLCIKAYKEHMFKESYMEVDPNDFSISGKMQIALEVIENFAKTFLNHDLENTPFTILQLENKEDFKSKFLIRIRDQKEEVEIELKGILDRLDRKDGITRIIDYKTGRDTLKFDSLAKLFQKDTKKPNKALLQTLFYTYITENVMQEANVEPHLWVVQEIKKGNGTLFTTQALGTGIHSLASEKPSYQVTKLQGELLETIKLEFKQNLKITFETLFDSEIPFTQTSILKNCEYCAYRSLCGR